MREKRNCEYQKSREVPTAYCRCWVQIVSQVAGVAKTPVIDWSFKSLNMSSLFSPDFSAVNKKLFFNLPFVVSIGVLGTVSLGDWDLENTEIYEARKYLWILDKKYDNSHKTAIEFFAFLFDLKYWKIGDK